MKSTNKISTLGKKSLKMALWGHVPFRRNHSGMKEGDIVKTIEDINSGYSLIRKGSIGHIMMKGPLKGYYLIRFTGVPFPLHVNGTKLEPVRSDIKTYTRKSLNVALLAILLSLLSLVLSMLRAKNQIRE